MALDFDRHSRLGNHYHMGAVYRYPVVANSTVSWRYLVENGPDPKTLDKFAFATILRGADCLNTRFDKFSLIGCTLVAVKPGTSALGPDDEYKTPSITYLVDYVIRSESTETLAELGGRANTGSKLNELLFNWGGASGIKARFASVAAFDAENVGADNFNASDHGVAQDLDGFWHNRPALAATVNGQTRQSDLITTGLNGGPFGPDGLSFAYGLSDHIQNLTPIKLTAGGGGANPPPVIEEGPPTKHPPVVLTNKVLGANPIVGGLAFVAAGAAGFLLIKQLRKAGL